MRSLKFSPETDGRKRKSSDRWRQQRSLSLITHCALLHCCCCYLGSGQWTHPDPPVRWISVLCHISLSPDASSGYYPEKLSLLCNAFQMTFPFFSRCKWGSLSVVLMCSVEALAASVPSWQCTHFVGVCLFVFTLFLHAFCLVSTQTLSVSFDPPASPVKSLCVVKKVLCKLSYYYYSASLILLGPITLIRAVNEGREPYLAH